MPTSYRLSLPETTDQIHPVAVLLQIYQLVSSDKDKARISQLIREELADYRKQIELSIETTNLYIGYTKRPAVAAEGIKMREDLRELDGIYESIASALR